VLEPDQIEDLDNLARTAKAVTFDSNPSGTARTLQPTGEAGAMISGAARAGLGLVTGNPAAVVEGAVPLAYGAGTRAVAKAITSPAMVDRLMQPNAAPGVGETLKSVATQPGTAAVTAAVPAVQQSANERQATGDSTDFKRKTDARRQPPAATVSAAPALDEGVIHAGSTLDQANPGTPPPGSPVYKQPEAPGPQSSVESPDGQMIPDDVAALLEEGVHHTFANGQIWTRVDGQPQKVEDETAQA
jgi:hypothetical protein